MKLGVEYRCKPTANRIDTHHSTILLYFLRNFLCSREQIKERLWKPGVIEHLTQSDKVSCGDQCSY